MSKQPAMTSTFPVNGTPTEQIRFLKRQIIELEMQKKCYDKMIKERKKAVKDLVRKRELIKEARKP